ncbi:hypothetical protein [Streptomyces sp. NPDC059063]|uniref:hypothetical protein n=1 Tax=unclassified Streptomyces TaxID=2593676 RepID=UPI0036B7D0FC
MRIAKSVKAVAATAAASAAAIIGLSAPADAAGVDGARQTTANNAASVDNENQVFHVQGYTWSN